MRDAIFEELRRTLAQTEEWLVMHFSTPSEGEAQLSRTLSRYLRHCKRDPRKWTDPVEARRTLDKIKRACIVLTMLRFPRKD